MDMAKPKGMFLRGSTWWARKDVSAELRKIVGQTSLQKSLGTADLEHAKIAFHGVMQGFQATIVRARQELAGEPVSDFIITFSPEELGLTKSQTARLLQIEQAKPENRVRAMLEQAKLIPAERDARSLDRLFEEWKGERKPTANTIAEYERAKVLFVALNGTLPIAEYTVEHARKWKQYAAALTSPTGKSLAHGSDTVSSCVWESRPHTKDEERCIEGSKAEECHDPSKGGDGQQWTIPNRMKGGADAYKGGDQHGRIDGLQGR
jgi:hypothetical protein